MRIASLGRLLLIGGCFMPLSFLYGGGDVFSNLTQVSLVLDNTEDKLRDIWSSPKNLVPILHKEVLVFGTGAGMIIEECLVSNTTGIIRCNFSPKGHVNKVLHDGTIVIFPYYWADDLTFKKFKDRFSPADGYDVPAYKMGIKGFFCELYLPNMKKAVMNQMELGGKKSHKADLLKGVKKGFIPRYGCEIFEFKAPKILR